MTRVGHNKPITAIFLDDEQVVLEGVKWYVTNNKPNWEVKFHTRPFDFVEVVDKCNESIDAIVCDVELPGISGTDILEAIKDAFPRIVRISISGNLDNGTLIGIKKHSDFHFCKPIMPDKLCKQIESLLANNRGDLTRR